MSQQGILAEGEGSISTFVLLVKIACLVEEKIFFSSIKGVEPNWLVKQGQSLPLTKDSLVTVTESLLNFTESVDHFW